MIKSKIRSILSGVKSRIFYSTCLVITTAVLSFMLFSGSIIKSSLNKGMDNMDRRLGSDIMLVPKGSREEAENLLLEGQRGTFYFDGSVDDKLKDIEGISEVTSQCFLKSLSADCCSSEVELVFYDPDTDFVVGPWIETNYKNSLKKDDVIVGSDIVTENGTIKLFGKDYEVVSQMAKTGTALDSSVYFSSESMASVIADAEEKNSFLTEEQKDGDILSSVFINLNAGYNEDDVIRECHEKAGDVFDVVYPKQLNESLSDNLLRITDIVGAVILIGGVLLFGILVLINSVIIESRKQEVALLRVLGNSKGKMAAMLISETGIVSLFGSLVGCLLGALIVIPFGRYIGMSLSMPYLGPDFIGSTLQIIFIMAIVFLVALVSSIVFVFHVTGIEPYLALKKEAE
ncbi:MAG: ABC transporter permease [Clostridia bacterium]|nr:ABC transporter permease [Clostridia bacterium]